MQLKSAFFGSTCSGPKIAPYPNMTCPVVTTCCQSNRRCCFISTPDSFNGQTVNFTLKPPKVIESTTYSSVPNRRAGRNQRAGGKILEKH